MTTTKSVSLLMTDEIYYFWIIIFEDFISHMKTNEKHSTFWVVDGLKIKKKEPFVVKEVNRQLVLPSKNKQHTPLLRPEESLVGDQRNFFTEKSYEDIRDKRMDYGMIRFSSLSSMRGGEIYPISFHQQTVQNVVICSPPVMVWKLQKKSPLFKNEFVKFQYNKTVPNIEEKVEQQDSIN